MFSDTMLLSWNELIRFVKLEDRKRAVVSRLLQYTLVHQMLGIPFDEIIIRRTPEGKPFLVYLCFCIYASSFR